MSGELPESFGHKLNRMSNEWLLKGGHDVSGEPRVPSGTSDGGQWTTGGSKKGKTKYGSGDPKAVKRFKEVWGGTPGDNQNFHEKEAAELLSGMSKDEVAELAHHMTHAGRGWRTVKPTPEGVLEAIHSRWGTWHRAQV